MPRRRVTFVMLMNICLFSPTDAVSLITRELTGLRRRSAGAAVNPLPPAHRKSHTPAIRIAHIKQLAESLPPYRIHRDVHHGRLGLLALSIHRHRVQIMRACGGVPGQLPGRLRASSDVLPVGKEVHLPRLA
jgi:hypothetical protein